MIRNETQMLNHKRRIDAERKARAIEARMARNRAAMHSVMRAVGGVR